MKSIALWFALALAAQAQVIMPNGQMADAFPRSLETPTGRIDIATPAQWIEAGGRYATAQEIADKEAADQAAQEEAAAAASLPLVCPNGVAVVVDTHHIKLVPILEDGVVLPVQISECDIEAGKASAMEASAVTAYKTGKAQAKAETQALKDAGKNAKLKDAERIALLEQRLGVLENKLFGVEK